MTIARADRYSRRALLKSMGVGLGMLPLLNAERAIGQTAAGVIKRFISITWTNGIVPANFYPVAGPLTGTLPPILSPLDPWKSKILAMRGTGSGVLTGGIDSKVMVDAGLTFAGHSTYASLLTGSWSSTGGAAGAGRPTSPSIDQMIGNNLATQGFAAPSGFATAALNLGCRPGTSSTSWGAGGTKNASVTDPYQLYTMLFSGPSSPPTGALRERRKSVIDFCLDDFTRFSSRLGTEDRGKINAHLESIRTIEGSLALTPGCLAPPNTPAGLNFKTGPDLNASFPTHSKLMLALIAAAVKCDIARAITLDMVDDGGGYGFTFPWLGIPSPDYNALAHQGAAGYAQKTMVDTWFYSQIADLVGQLAANPEGATTSLDSSVILVCNDCNDGASEMVTNLPYLMVGSGGGFFKQGICVQFPVNVPNNRLLTSICHAMDLPVASVGTGYPGDLDATLKA